MKKFILLSISILSFCFLSQRTVAIGGVNCSEAVEIVKDTNHCTFTNDIDYQWFKINVPAGKKIFVSNCDFPEIKSSISNEFYSDCSWNRFTTQTKSCDSYNFSRSTMVNKDTVVYIQWHSYSALEFDFVCKIMDPKPGEFSQVALTASEGLNTSFSNGNPVWYKYTAELDSKVTIKGVAPYDDGYVYVYNKDMDQVTSSSYPLDSKIFCKKGETFYFRIEYYYNTPINWEFKVEPDGNIIGKDCEYTILAKEGLNRVNNDKFTKQYFKYKATQNGVVTVSTCNLTTASTLVSLIENCSNSASHTGISCGKQITAEYKMEKGDSVYIIWSSDDDAAYDFDLKFTSYSSIQGSTKDNPFSITSGTHTVNEIRTDQWYKVVSPIKGSIYVSTCGLTNEDTYIQTYIGYPSGSNYNNTYSDDDCGSTNNYQSKVTLKVKIGDTCYIRLNNNYAHSGYDFKVEFLPLNNEASLFDFNIISDSWDSTKLLTVKKTINQTAKTINLTVPKNISLSSSLYVLFKISERATLRKLSGYSLYNGASVSFSAPLTCKLISEDSSIIDTWTITVTNEPALSSDKKFINFRLGGQIQSSIDTVNHKINTVLPYYGSLTNRTPYFTVSAMATVKRGSVTISSGSNYTDFTKPDTLTVIAEDNSSQIWVVTVTKQTPPTGGTCENPLTAVVGKNDFVINQDVYYKFTAPSKGRYSFVNYSGSEAYFYFRHDSCNSNNYNYYYPDNGDSVVLLVNQGDFVIISTRINRGYWFMRSLPLSSEKEVLNYTVGDNIVVDIDRINHKINLTAPASNTSTNFYVQSTWSQGSTVKIGTTEQDGYDYVNFASDVVYNVTAQDGTTQNWTVSLKTAAALTGKDFISFSVPYQLSEAIIDAEKATAKVSVADTTNLSRIMPFFIVSKSAKAYINSVNQYNGGSIVDFTNPVAYKIVAEDASIKNWTVTVVKGIIKSNLANVIAFHLPDEVFSVIDTATRTINVSLKSTAFNNLVASFTLSKGAAAKIGTTAQLSGTTSNNFSTTLTYLVTSEDGLITKNWTVKVAKAKNTETQILTYSILGCQATINDLENRISLDLPATANLNSLVASFTLSEGATAKVNSTSQVSGTTTNSFSTALVYTITAEDGTTSKGWTVNVNKAKLGDAKITSYSCFGNAGTINETAKTITVNVPKTSDLSQAVAEFAISSGAVAKVGEITQVSGTSKNNFSSSVIYSVTSEDGKTTVNYTVTINAILGISEIAENLKLYPNPASDFVTLKLNETSGKIKVELINLLGKVVYSNTYSNNNNNLMINLSKIKSGSYYIRISTKNNSETTRLEVVK